MKYIQSKVTDFYKLVDDFNELKEKLSEKNFGNEINDLMYKVQADINDLKDGELLVEPQKIKGKQKVKVTYLTDNKEVIDEILKFDMDVDNPIIDINFNKIPNKIEFFVITQTGGKKKVTKEVKKRVFDVIDRDLISSENQSKLF